MMRPFFLLRSLIEAALQLIGTLLRIALLAVVAAVVLRISGLAGAELLPGFWLVVGVGCIVLLPAGITMGRREAYREERDRAIEQAEEKYRGRV